MLISLEAAALRNELRWLQGWRGAAAPFTFFPLSVHLPPVGECSDLGDPLLSPRPPPAPGRPSLILARGLQL